MAHITKDRVKETTTTTGTGPFTLAGAPAGFRSMGSVCAVGDTFRGTIQGVDASGVPTGEWQSGTFVYSAAGQITTLVVEDSSTGSAVSFSAGTKEVWIGLTATQAAWARENLMANRTYYVRTDGNDANTGLVNTAGGAFLTIQKALNVISGSIDLNGYDVTVQIADGTYTGAIEARPLVGYDSTGYKRVRLLGNSTTPANVVVSTTSVSSVTNRVSDVRLQVEYMRLQTTTSGHCIQALGFGAAVVFTGVEFGTCAGAHIFFATGGSVSAFGNYSIVGGALAHWSGYQCGRLSVTGFTITLTGTPAFSGQFASLTGCCYGYAASNTYSGSATGTRYSVTQLSNLETGGATLPGSVAGSVATGGQFS